MFTSIRAIYPEQLPKLAPNHQQTKVKHLFSLSTKPMDISAKMLDALKAAGFNTEARLSDGSTMRYYLRNIIEFESWRMLLEASGHPKREKLAYVLLEKAAPEVIKLIHANSQARPEEILNTTFFIYSNVARNFKISIHMTPGQHRFCEIIDGSKSYFDLDKENTCGICCLCRH